MTSSFDLLLGLIYRLRPTKTIIPNLRIDLEAEEIYLLKNCFLPPHSSDLEFLPQ